MFQTVNSMWRHMRGQRLRYGGAIGALVVASCFLYLVPLIPQATIDGVLLPDAEREPSMLTSVTLGLLGGESVVGDRLWLPAAAIGLLTICAGVFTYLRSRWSAQASESIARRLRNEVYDHLQHLPCRYFDEAETGDLLQRCTSDVETFRVFLSTQIVEVGRAILMFLIPIPLMLMIDIRMTIAALVLAPFILVFSAFYFLRVRDAFREKDEAEGAMTATIQENLTAIRVVKAFARQDYERSKFAERNDLHRSLDLALFRLFARFWSISDLLCFSQKGIVVAFGAWLLARGELQVGAFFFFLSAVAMFIWPIQMMGRILSELGKAVVAIERIEEILAVPRESSADEDGRPPIDGEITFDRVTFHHGAECVLDNVSFTVRPGETLGVLGPSGGGKTTLVNLLLRLYDYENGSVRIDGRELNTLPREWVRSNIAVVMQEPFLYSRSLGENIAMGRRSAEQDELVEATTVSAVHDSIERFEQGYETVVGERGVTLSGGQRQRVALSRALLQDAPILILDDALSAVDTDTESRILSALRSRERQQTTIVIAHRLSTLMHADRIIVLESGRVTQCGSHESLRNEPGLYGRLWRIQSAEASDQRTESIGGRTR
ncbi:MAG: ABC transporter ATP-binding protein [Phycisphaerales bacterium]